MTIVWILGILAVVVGAGALIDRNHRAGMSELSTQTQADTSRRRFASGANTSSWGYFGGGDGGAGFGGGFDGGGCGGDGGGGSC